MRQILADPTQNVAGARVLREIRTPVADIQVIEWLWPSPMDETVCETRHMLEMSLPPFATDGSAAFPDIAADRFSYIGAMFQRPAGVTLRARSAGGRIQVLRCASDPAQYAEIVGRDTQSWSEPELRAGLHLRSRAVHALFSRLRGEVDAPGLATPALAEAYATALMIETARAVAGAVEAPAEGRLAAWQHRRVTERLQADGPPPTVTELAALCGVSSRHLLRLYRALTGESVLTQIERAQIARAKALLTDSDLPLKVIAARLGFTHPGSFSTAFRRSVGVSPRLYRQRGETALH